MSDIDIGQDIRQQFEQDGYFILESVIPGFLELYSTLQRRQTEETCAVFLLECGSCGTAPQLQGGSDEYDDCIAQALPPVLARYHHHRSAGGPGCCQRRPRRSRSRHPWP